MNNISSDNSLGDQTAPVLANFRAFSLSAANDVTKRKSPGAPSKPLITYPLFTKERNHAVVKGLWAQQIYNRKELEAEAESEWILLGNKLSSLHPCLSRTLGRITLLNNHGRLEPLAEIIIRISKRVPRTAEPIKRLTTPTPKAPGTPKEKVFETLASVIQGLNGRPLKLLTQYPLFADGRNRLEADGLSSQGILTRHRLHEQLQEERLPSTYTTESLSAVLNRVLNQTSFVVEPGRTFSNQQGRIGALSQKIIEISRRPPLYESTLNGGAGNVDSLTPDTLLERPSISDDTLLPRKVTVGASNDRYIPELDEPYFIRKLISMRADATAGLSNHIGPLAALPNVGSDDRSIEQEDFDAKTRALSRYQGIINSVNKAIKRIELGTYGECEDTGDEIPLTRLLANPLAVRTIEAEGARELRKKIGTQNVVRATFKADFL